MIISKDFLKKIIKEEIEKTLAPDEYPYEKLYSIKAIDFLSLTTPEGKPDKSLIARFQSKQIEEYNPCRAGNASLNVNLVSSETDNWIGQVTGHEGRLRCYANIQLNGDEARQNVLLRTKKELPSSPIFLFDQLRNQFNPKIVLKAVSLQEPQKHVCPEDPLQIGSSKRVIRPTKYTEAQKELIPLIRMSYYDVYLKQLGKTKEEKTKEELTNAYAAIINSMYSITDDKGTSYSVSLKSSGYIGTPIFDPPIPKDATLTIQKK